MQYSPKLKKAAEEIKSIIKKYDIGAIVILHTPGFAEYLFEVSPSYSCISIKNDGYAHIKAKASEIGIEARNKLLTETTDMILSLEEIGIMLLGNALSLKEQLEKSVKIEDAGPGNHSSHTEQNN